MTVSKTFLAVSFANCGRSGTLEDTAPIRTAYEVHSFPTKRERDAFVEDSPYTRATITARRVSSCTTEEGDTHYYVTRHNARRQGIYY